MSRAVLMRCCAGCAGSGRAGCGAAGTGAAGRGSGFASGCFAGSTLALLSMEHFGAREANTCLGGAGSGSVAPQLQKQGRDWL